MGRLAIGLGLAGGIVALLSLGFWLADPGGPPQDRPLPPRVAGTEPLRIVAFGTSLTTRATWPDDLAALLQTCRGPGAEVVRHSKPGAGSTWALDQVAEVVGLKPDLVIMEFAINDGDLLDRISKAESVDQHLRLIRALREGAPESEILLMTTNPVAGRARWKRPTLRDYYALYPDIAQAADTGLLDGYRRWLAVPDWDDSIPDGVHPDPAVESRILTPALVEAVAAGFGLSCPPQPTSP